MTREIPRDRPACPQCHQGGLSEPHEREDGLPGILYRDCNVCGYVKALTRRPRKVRLND